ncbi:Hypothetical_protein [Hexamita inflata]|uniref:Hypothetical_protein n=1 Tax=Hexamita inflata TaxID=28002 RepID=A0AA86R0M0_9EUKA|nr:Hypothetical protein HINF_LOCUS54507 [Hexamita inflata]
MNIDIVEKLSIDIYRCYTTTFSPQQATEAYIAKREPANFLDLFAIAKLKYPTEFSGITYRQFADQMERVGFAQTKYGRKHVIANSFFKGKVNVIKKQIYAEASNKVVQITNQLHQNYLNQRKIDLAYVNAQFDDNTDAYDQLTNSTQQQAPQQQQLPDVQQQQQQATVQQLYPQQTQQNQQQVQQQAPQQQLQVHPLANVEKWRETAQYQNQLVQQQQVQQQLVQQQNLIEQDQDPQTQKRKYIKRRGQRIRQLAKPKPNKMTTDILTQYAHMLTHKEQQHNKEDMKNNIE